MVDGKTLRFHLAGINNQNFIMQDDVTGTWWQQVSGEAIRGPLQGKRLQPVTWDEVRFSLWKQENPQSLVLCGVDKFQEDYLPADWDIRILTRPTVTPIDPRDSLKPRDLVVGIRIDSAAKAYPLELLKKHNPISDQLGPLPLLLLVDSDGKSVRAFDRRMQDQILDLYLKPNVDPLTLMDSQTGSEWSFWGQATSGPLAGEKLRPIQTLKDFWFDWKLYNPLTRIFTSY